MTNAASRLPATSAWRTVFAMGIAGLCFGFSLAVVPVYLTYDALNEDCTADTAEDACTATEHTDCVWVTAAPLNASSSTRGGRCDFADYATVNCSTANGNADACGAVTNANGGAACTYDYQDDTCARAFGLSAVLQGVYAAANVLGGFFGAPAANLVSRRFGFRGGAVALALLALVPTVVASVARAVDSIGFMIAARVFMGIMGWGACFLGPLYAAHSQPAAMAATIQTAFQVFVDSGLVLGAVYGLALEPTDFSRPTHMEARIHGLHALQGLLAVVWIIVGVCVAPESPFFDKASGGLQPVPVESGDDEGAEAAKQLDAVVAVDAEPQAVPAASPTDDGSSLGFAARLRLYVLGVGVASALQMTGVGPFVAFAPVIASETGLRPLQGNLLVSVLFTLGAAMGPFIGRRVDQRKGYIAGALSTTVGCLLIAVAVMPGLLGDIDSARFALSSCGILIFSIGFNALSGTFFFVWAQRIYPSSLVAAGSTVANTAAAIEQMVNTFVFPVAVVGISGGLAGDQRVGTAAMFFVYGGLGAVFTVLMALFMHPYRPTTTVVGSAPKEQQVSAVDV